MDCKRAVAARHPVVTRKQRRAPISWPRRRPPRLEVEASNVPPGPRRRGSEIRIWRARRSRFVSESRSTQTEVWSRFDHSLPPAVSRDKSVLMKRTELARAVFQISHRTGNFRLRSGKTSTEYFDKYQFESNPALLSAIAEALAPSVPPGVDALAGLEMGGIPIATALSLKTGLPCVFVRKTAKTYGTCKFAEGPDVGGKRLLLIEDVITTGGQVAQSAADLRGDGAKIDSVMCVIDRSEGQTDKLTSASIAVRALFTMAELKAAGA